MILHTRRASLLIAFYLLTSAATAHAECAWLLWGRIADDPIGVMTKKGWFVRASFDRRNDCLKAYTLYLNDMRRLGWVVSGGEDHATGSGATIVAPPEMVSLAQYREKVVCRPDSASPTTHGTILGF